MRSLLLALALTAIAPAISLASTAQDRADALAATGENRRSSCSKNEGVGFGSSPEAAKKNCCGFGRRIILDEGVAWSPLRRRWVAVLRYR